MYFGCRGEDWGYEGYDKVIRESWGRFTGWFMTRAEYMVFNHLVYPEVAYRDTRGGMICFDLPHQHNVQDMTLFGHQTSSTLKYYTPLFIDLVDDSNQKDYYRIKEPWSESIYPDDKIVVYNYMTLSRIVSIAGNIASLKAHMLENAMVLGTTEKAINDYFAFYGV